MKQILSLIFATGLTLPMAGLAGQYQIIPDQWIVELEHDATLEYRGGDRRSGAALMSGGRVLEATAPDGNRLDTSAPHVVAYAEFLDRERSEVLSQARNRLGREIRPRSVYRHVINGFSVQMSEAEARELAALPGVRRVTPDVAWQLETDRGPQMIGAPAVWDGESSLSSRGEGVVIGVIDTGINWDHRYFSDDPSATGGYTFSNPLGEQLGECSRPQVQCNDKLIGVWDFTDEGTFGRDPDDEGHGTHVASIAAGNAWTFELQEIDGTFATSGVAPRANIISYKVCYSEDYEDDNVAGRCPGEAIAGALEQVVEDGVDIINYSMGFDFVAEEESGDPWERALSFLNIRNAGILFVTSAGNSGPDAGSITSPANAPWTFAVGSTTHGRQIGHRADVVDLTDLFVEPGTGPEIESTISAPIIVADQAGSDLEGCNAYDDDVLAGTIAYVKRGSCTFEVKVDHAADAGALAVLVYNNEPGEGAIVMGGLENTTIPAGMIGNSDGELALAEIRGSANPTATLYDQLNRLVDENLQDRVSIFSSRGPGSDSPGIMKPNVMAPGEAILAGLVPDEHSLDFNSGTSMASPHVAGAAALLKAMHPDWSPVMLQSALETTAEAGPVKTTSGEATILDRGAGRIRVDEAANIGLYLPIGVSDFQAANPASGGDPEALNLAGIFTDNCTQDCNFTRTVEAIHPGSWTVTTPGDLDIEVTPDSFTLIAGQQQELNITVDGSSLGAETVLEGAVVLTPADDSLSIQRLPVGMVVAAAGLPSQLVVSASSNRGRSDYEVDVLAGLEEAVFRTSSLVRPVEESFDLGQDPSPEDPFSGGEGTRTQLVDVPEEALMLMVDVIDSSAVDIDLFVGRDKVGDGQADPDEVVCEATSTGTRERCRIENPEPGTWWILVQNHQASSTPGDDWVELEYALLSESEDYSLVATGPGRHDGGALEFSLAWDQPAMRRGERWVGAVGLASSKEALADLGVIPVRVRRNAAVVTEPTPLFANQAHPVVVPAGEQHDLLYFDVSPGATSVSVSVDGGADISARLQYMEFNAVAGYAPGTPPAAGELMASHTGSIAGFTLTADAQPGRWYVVLENAGTSEALVDVDVAIEEDEPQMSQRGLWSPRDRVIHQGIEWQRAGEGFLTWYSYDATGLPVFYQAASAIDSAHSTWTAPLERVTNGTGERQLYDQVGEVSLTMISDDEMVFAWRHDGHHGSEIMAPDAARTCPQVYGEQASYSGHWYSPGELVGGTTVIVTDTVQGHIRYYFDDLGVGRWLLANDPESDPLNEVLELLDYRGFCPGCDEAEVQMHVVGLYERSFDSDSSGSERLDFISAEPLSHDITIEVPISKLSEPLECR